MTRPPRPTTTTRGVVRLRLAWTQGGQERTLARQLDFEVDDIPFAETRAYVDKVLEARDDYAEAYPAELGVAE